MTTPRRALTAIAALAAIALMAAPCEARAATDSPWPDLRRSINGLFAPPARVRRATRRSARLHPSIQPVPLPRPRPADPVQESRLPAAAPLPPKKPAELSRTEPAPAEAPPPSPRPASDAPPSAEAPSACQLRLTPDIAVAHPLPPITGPGECSADDVVRLDAVVLRDGGHVTLTPAATLRCPMAEAVAQWVRDELVPAASGLGGKPRTLVVAASYDCRGRNRVLGAKLSEHGHANAIDLRGLTLADGTMIDFAERSVSREFRERIRQSACERFMTVLGPGSDGYHEKHIHLDLIERHGGHRMCQWEISPAPDVAAVPLPPERPHPPADGKH